MDDDVFFSFLMSSPLLLVRNSLGENEIGDAGMKAVQDAVKDNTFTDDGVAGLIEKALSKKASTDETLDAVAKSFHYNLYDKVLLLIKDGEWKKTLEAKVEAEYSKQGKGKVSFSV